MVIKNLLLPVSTLLRLYIYFIIIFTTGRAVLFAYYYPRLLDSDSNIWLTFLYGFRMDTIAACLFLLVPTLFIHFTPRIFLSTGQAIIRVYLLVVFVFAIYMENATLPFINEYDVRPNVLFINYLKYPEEVLPTIWATYKLELIVSFIMMSVAGWWFMRSSKSLCLDVFEIPLWKRAILFIPVLFVLFVGIRSSFDHRPANPSDAIFSDNRLVNEITKNTLHNVGYALYSSLRHDGSTKSYGVMPFEEAKQRVSKRLNIVSDDESLPFRRMVKSHFSTTRQKNLVIVIEESMGALFVEAVGGEPDITPRFNELSSQGLLFTKLYSNGTRSIRGIAGTVSGFLPAPGLGVVKRNLSQKNFFTVASLLKPLGYSTSFFYGGESRFDNMKSWFSGNGFDEIFEESSFDNSVFHGTWGVDDFTVVERANEVFKQSYRNGKPFVSVIFSTTNHTPFDFPAGKIELVKNVPEKSVKNAVKYADFSIGRLIDLARENNYYDDTVFMIVADHNIRVYGDDVLPVDMFHIPGLILGGGVKPGRVDAVTTQPDLLATALDLLGMDFQFPILGQSIFSDKKTAISLMQYHDIYGLRLDNKIAIIQPDQPAATYQIQQDDHLTEIEHDQELEKDALAFIVVLDEMYKRSLFN